MVGLGVLEQQLADKANEIADALDKVRLASSTISSIAPALGSLAGFANFASNALENAANTAQSILVAPPPSRATTTATSGEFRAFTVGALGNFPYYWQNPRNLSLNSKTQNWIQSALKANADPVELNGIFTNLFISALSKVRYSLSTADAAKLNNESALIQQQQTALLLAWQTAFGQLPSGPQPINAVMDEITNTWATPSTTFSALKLSTDITRTLNTVPASGQSVLPSLATYLNTLGSSPLTNATAMNNAYVAQALDAVQSPNIANGGVPVSNGGIEPAYLVATPLSQILADLNGTDGKFTMPMAVSRSTSGKYIVVPESKVTATVPATGFLSIKTKSNPDLFQNKITAVGQTSKVMASFENVAKVYFGPVPFSMSTGKSWFYAEPIVQAIRNTGKDVSGFKFSPMPQIDFSKAGPFGMVTGVLISKNPKVSITMSDQTFAAIWPDLQSGATHEVYFLGRSLGDTADCTVSTVPDAATSSTTVTFTPTSVSTPDSVTSTAYVLGVKTEFPAA